MYSLLPMTKRLAILVGMLVGAACDLAPLPFFGEVDEPDSGETLNAGPGLIACQPASRRCVGNSVRVCSADGTDFTIEPCGVGDTCNVDACAPIANTCETDQPFALSATELAFDVSRDFKSQTKQVQLHNCSAGPIIVRDIKVRGPQRPDATPVFELVGNTVLQSIPASESAKITVTYRPTAGHSHATGRLEINLVLGEFTNVEVALRSKALCASVTPYIDYGMRQVTTPLTSDARVQNCGTEPMVVTGWDSPDHVELSFDQELPHELQPGAELGFDVTTRAESPSVLDANVSVTLDDSLLRPGMLRLRGIGVHADCVPLALSEAQILANNQERPPRPGNLVRIRFPDAAPGVFHWLEPLRQPQGSFERVDRAADAWTTHPRMVGRYRATLRGYDIMTGSPSCEFDEVVFEVQPSDGLHVELSWISEGDGIPEDLGFGHSTNLDLHVLSTTDGEGRWNHPETDCFPGVIGPCGAGGGTISVSQGGLPEFVRFSRVDGLQFEVGVYLSNTFNFPAVRARVRVFRDQTLVADLVSTSLQNANDFWLVGRYDQSLEQWTEINSVFSGFPH